LNVDQAMAGFGDQTVIFIASLFVVSAGLDAGGVTTWAGQQLIRWAGDSQSRLLLLMMLLVAALTALITPNGSIAALLPVVIVVAGRLARPTSQLLMPLVFGAHAGSMLALTGTPLNVLVSDAANESTGAGFAFFEFALVGIPLLAGTVTIVTLFGERLLPARAPRRIPPDLSRHAHTLSEQYLLHDGIAWLRVRPDSPVIGQDPEKLAQEAYEGVSLIAVQSGTGGTSTRCIQANDLLIVRGSADQVQRLATERALGIRSGAEGAPEALLTSRLGLAEVVVPPRSELIGEAVFPGMTNDRGDLVILAVQRRGEDLGPAQTALNVGDTMLIQGTWDALDENLDTPDFLIVDSPEVVRRQAVPVGPDGKRAVAVLVAMVVLLASGVVPPVVAGLLAAGGMLVLGIISVSRAYRSINWTTVVLVGAMIPLSTAMADSGAAEDIAQALVGVVGDSSPYLLALSLFLMTAAFGQLMSNTATILIMIPIVLSGASEVDVSPRPLLMGLTVSAAAAFLTPVATPVNLIVMEPGGYRFGDYWKLGLPLLLLFVLVATFLVPVFWSF
jgi:di/tricarboxylate transporter